LGRRLKRCERRAGKKFCGEVVTDLFAAPQTFGEAALEGLQLFPRIVGTVDHFGRSCGAKREAISRCRARPRLAGEVRMTRCAARIVDSKTVPVLPVSVDDTPITGFPTLDGRAVRRGRAQRQTLLKNRLSVRFGIAAVKTWRDPHDVKHSAIFKHSLP